MYLILIVELYFLQPVDNLTLFLQKLSEIAMEKRVQEISSNSIRMDTFEFIYI